MSRRDPPRLSAPTRRSVLALAGLGALATLTRARLSFAEPLGRPPGLVVWVLLRGGLDGLYAVPAFGDPAFARARGPLADYPQDTLRLDNTFALHPALTGLDRLHRAGKLAVVHAVASPYRDRSHFDAQQLVESGGTTPHALTTGWLGRAVHALRAGAVALSPTAPLSLRGAEGVDTWTPSYLAEPDEDLLDRLGRLYVGDSALAGALVQSRLELQRAQAEAEAGALQMGAEREAAGLDRNTRRRAVLRGDPVRLARRAAELLREPDGPSVAMLELTGWDSHAGQTAPQGRLVQNLRALDTALATLTRGLGDALERTSIVVASEFGRSVAPNGTDGTDHGTAGVCFVIGGGPQRSGVLGAWPGVERRALHEGRDLRPTTDLRSVLKAVLRHRLGLADALLDREVFPDSAQVAAMPDLFG